MKCYLNNFTSFNDVKKTMIENDIGIDFIALILTSWHLDNLISYLSIKNYSQGIVLVFPQFREKNKSYFRLKPEHFHENYKNINNIFFIENNRLTFNYKGLFHLTTKFDKKKITIISPGRINYRLISNLNFLGKKFNYVIIDEGLGGYFPQHYFEKVATRSSENSTLRKNNIIFYFQFFIKFFIRLLFIRSISDFKIFTNKKGQFVPNKIMCDALIEYYSLKSKYNKKKAVIFFKDFQILNYQQLEDIYKFIFDNLKINGWLVYVKKHPNDVEAKFDDLIKKYDNINLLNTIESGEQIVANIKPEFIIGGFSTVLFSSAAIFSSKAISYMMLYRNIKGISKAHLYLINWMFKKLEKCLDNLFFVEKLENILELIKKEKDD